MKVGIACSGGSLRGVALHAGFFLGLQDLGVEYQALAGTSAGGLAAGFIGSGMTPQQYQDIALQLKVSDYWDISWKHQIKSVFRSWRGWTGYVSGDPMRKFLQKILPIEMMEECPIPTYIVVFNVSCQKKEVFSSGPLVNIMRATSAIPLVFEVEKIGDFYFWDGGGITNLPAFELAEAVEDLDLIIVSSAVNVDRTASPDNGFMDDRFSFVEASERYIHTISGTLITTNILLAENDTPVLIVQHSGANMGIRDVEKVPHAIEVGRENTLQQIRDFMNQPGRLSVDRSLEHRVRDALDKIVKTKG